MTRVKSLVKGLLGRNSIPLLEFYYLCRFWLNLGKARFCPCCERNLKRFLPAAIGSRADVLDIRCPRCDAHPRHRLLWLYLREKHAELFSEPLHMLHLAPEFCFLRRLRRCRSLDYVTGDLASPMADERLDVTCLPYPEHSFDVIFCNHVLEHVADDHQAMCELFRVLKPGGWALLQVPIELSRKVTYEDWTITEPEERERHFGQNDHVRVYGADYSERLQQAGFVVDCVDFAAGFDADQREYYGLHQDEPVFFCSRPQIMTSSGEQPA